jgi:hypothetical protein
VTCTVKGDREIRCRVVFVGKASRARSVRLRISRAGVTYAKGSAKRRVAARNLRLRSARPLRAGTYTLSVLTTNKDGRTTVRRTTLEVR